MLDLASFADDPVELYVLAKILMDVAGRWERGGALDADVAQAIRGLIAPKAESLLEALAVGSASAATLAARELVRAHLDSRA